MKPHDCSDDLIRALLILLGDARDVLISIKGEQTRMANRVEESTGKIMAEVDKANASLDNIKVDEADLAAQIAALKDQVTSLGELTPEEVASLDAAFAAVAAIAAKAADVADDVEQPPTV